MRWCSRSVTALLAVVAVVLGGWSVPASAAYSSQAGPSWVPNGVVKAMVRHGAVVYLGGSFTALTDPISGARVIRNRVAAVDAATGEPLSWDPGANGLVDAIAVGPDHTVYLGGEFTAVAGRTATRLAAVTPLGARVPGWSARANNTVHDLYADGTSLYVGGRFGAINGVNRGRIARLDSSTGALVGGFNAAVTGGRVMAIERSADGQSLLLGGAFTSVDGQPRSFAAAVAPDTGDVAGWNPGAACATCYLWDLATTADAVHAAVGGPGGRVVSWDAVTGAGRWSRSGDGNVQAIDVRDGVVYAGGHFGPTFDSSIRHQLVALDAGSGDLQPYTVAFTGSDHPGIWAVDADADGLRIAGGFVLDGNPARRYAVLPLL